MRVAHHGARRLGRKFVGIEREPGDLRLGVEFMAISSYGASMRSSGEVRIVKDLDVPVDGRDILIVEDIVDTGLTLSFLIGSLHQRGAKSVRPTSSRRMSRSSRWRSR